MELSMKKLPFNDDDLRRAFQIRAAGIPRPDLRHRIRRATRTAHEPMATGVIAEAGGHLAFFARFTAVAAVAVALLIAPLAGAGPGDSSAGNSLVDASHAQETTSATSAAPSTPNEDDDRDDDEDDIRERDDVGDDEDGVSEKSTHGQ